MDKQSILAEEQIEWWEATERDNFDINEKLKRVGCRPLKRRYLACKQAQRNNDFIVGCDDLKAELDKCIKLVQYMQSSYSTNKRDS